MPTLRETNIILESELEFKPYNTEHMTQSNEPTIEEMNYAIGVFAGKSFAGSHITDYTAKNAPDMRYHTSWDWLMPVGKKIYELLVDMSKKRRPHTACHGDLLELDISCHIREYDINKAHKAVYQFITWYNQQKQKDGEG